MSAPGLDEAIRRRGVSTSWASPPSWLEAVLVVSSLLMRRHEQVLDRGAVRTEAVVKDSRDYRLRPEGAAVRYEVNSQMIETILTVDEAADFVEGERVTVEFDPKNPHHARPLKGWNPTYEYLLVVALLVAVALAAIFGQEAWRDLQTARAVREQDLISTMHCLVYSRWRWRWKPPFPDVEFLVALWPTAAPISDPPAMAVGVSEWDSRDIPRGPVTVHGKAEPGRRVMLEAGGEFFWPRWKVLRELPDTARAIGLIARQ